MECLTKCNLNQQKITMHMLADRDNDNTTIKELNAQKKGINYRLEYAPVGNNIPNPSVIICGITPGNDTWKLFLNAIRNGVLIEKAGYESIYSNMRENLFQCLNNIGLFDYLTNINEYWNESEKSKKDSWGKIFINQTASRSCGIQLTQMCNCAILRNNDSKQPSKAALNEIRNNEPRCFFNSFQKNSSLKLIIFLGTTLNLGEYWKKSCYYDPSFIIFSIPHPSGSNRVFNNGDLFRPISENDSTQLRNAKSKINDAQLIINNLRDQTIYNEKSI